MFPTGKIPLIQHDILDARDCERTREAVMSLHSRWLARSPAPDFFTLGAASYLDATKEPSEYIERAQAANPVLKENFGWLHETIRLFFEEQLGERVFYDDEYALPGFHVFVLNGEDRSDDKPWTRAHFDLQWMHAIPEHDPTGTLSFTLPIESPTGGSSMEIWRARFTDALWTKSIATRYASEHRSQIIAYRPGRMVVHDGFLLHAIGAAAIVAPKGHRITLQGHGIRMPEGWLLYW